jgi:hypothetical protein
MRFNALSIALSVGSSDVFWTHGMPQFWSLWQCKKCGYREEFILEDGNFALKLEEEWKKRLRMDGI